MKINDYNSGNKLKAAVIGCGKMGVQHIKAIQAKNFSKIIGLVDPDANLEQIISMIENPINTYSSVADLFHSEKPDVVHIVTPPHSHFDLARTTLNFGANVYIEKPFTLTKSDAEELCALSQEKGLKICAGHQLLFQPIVSESIDTLSLIGRVVHLESYFAFHKVRKSISTADQLIDILPHPICLLMHFINKSISTQSESVLDISYVGVDKDGEVRALIKRGSLYGALFVTLQGRPVDSYLKIIGTNGSLKLDFVRGIVIKTIGPGHDAISAVIQPFSSGLQTLYKSVHAFGKLALKKSKSYQGLSELIEAFHKSIINQGKPPIPYNEILDVVDLTEIISKKIKISEQEFEFHAKDQLMEKAALISYTEHRNEIVLVTGGAGFLGKAVTSELIRNGWPVRVISRNIPAYSNQVPGVEYQETDLSGHIKSDIFQDVVAIVHCAAETSGGKFEHERNTIKATENLIDSAYKAGVQNFIHISSVAVLKSSREKGLPLDENSVIDHSNLSRGPYVWGKAEAEIIAKKQCEKLSLNLRIIRLGPLVDFNEFSPPGRLGRNVGSSFLAVGSRKSKLSLTDVHTAAKVIEAYVRDFNSMPRVLNLIDPDEPTRVELTARLRKIQPKIKVFWIPPFLISAMSPFLFVLQKILSPGKKPINIQAAFISEKYNTDLAQQIIKKIDQN